MSMIPPSGCDCCVCRRIHCMLDHPGHNKHLLPRFVFGEDWEDDLQMLLDAMKDRKNDKDIG